MIERLRRELSAERADLVEHLARGGASDYNEYCKAVGAIQTLDRVLSEIEELEKKLVEE